MTLGQRIIQYRKALGLSQEALAELVGVSRQAVSKWELDEAQPDAAKIVLLAQALGVTTDQLLLGEDEEESQAEAEWVQDQVPPPQTGQNYPAALGRLLARHGYKAGYLLIGYGALMLLVAAVMFLMVHGFFGAADDMLPSDPWHDLDHGNAEFHLEPGVSLSPEEIDAIKQEFGVIEQEIGHSIHGGDWHD